MSWRTLLSLLALIAATAPAFAGEQPPSSSAEALMERGHYKQARAVHVDSRGIVEALKNIYGATNLVNELTGSNPGK